MDSILTDGGRTIINGQRIGYFRVSSLDQNPDRQLEQIPVDRTFTDMASGKDVARPQLDALLRFAREGIRSSCTADRLARNLDDLRRHPGLVFRRRLIDQLFPPLRRLPLGGHAITHRPSSVQLLHPASRSTASRSSRRTDQARGVPPTRSTTASRAGERTDAPAATSPLGPLYAAIIHRLERSGKRGNVSPSRRPMALSSHSLSLFTKIALSRIA